MEFGDGPINLNKFMDVAKTVLGPRHANEADTLDEVLNLFQTVHGELLETLGMPTAGLRQFCVKLRVGMKAAGVPIDRRLAYAGLVLGHLDVATEK